MDTKRNYPLNGKALVYVFPFTVTFVENPQLMEELKYTKNEKIFNNILLSLFIEQKSVFQCFW